MMNVLVTGAFGNLGSSTILELIKQNHNITCFDIETKKNKKQAKKLRKRGNFRIIWGDIENKDSVVIAVKNQDCIIHLAGITPPLTEKNPDLAQKINVEGTKNVIKIAKKEKKLPKIIFPSSISIYGPQTPNSPPRTSEHPINPIDVYTKTKVKAEKIIQESGLPWIIFRITAAPSLSIRSNELELLYEMPLDQKIEFVHTYDVGLALANIIKIKSEGEILMLGGGEKCQYINRDFLLKYFKVLGIGMLPEVAFKIPKNENDWYYTNWLDTKESQKLLDYQYHTLDDFLAEIQKKIRFIRWIILLIRPLIRKSLISRSPYHKVNKKTQKKAEIVYSS